MNNQLIVNNQLIALDNSGYLLHLEDWSALVCEELASREEIQLTDDHKEIIHLIQSFYNEYQLSHRRASI
ncbi:UNVERIFIED_CONTAM: hypothetical protein GTU68_052701 [Idotea baltica]|nr:hypothetical protein [Idotea baltica]